MSGSIFSTYTTGENRVTASILAVLKSLALGRIERLLGALMGESEFELVRFQNQPAKGGRGVPDAAIVSSCRLLVETKIGRKAIDPAQLRRHLKRLDKASETTQRLLALTPDDSCPDEIQRIADGRLVWASFSALDQAIEELLDDKAEVVSEREAFLLRQLQTMLVEEGLLASATDVLVVPARHAWPEYHEVHAYACQPKRPFQPVKRIAFYSGGQIHPVVPTILKTYQSVMLEAGKFDGRLGEVVDKLLKCGLRDEGTSSKVMLLSPPDDAKTIHLKAPIINDLQSETGRQIAFTQNQRYVSLERLKTAKTTSQLVDE